MFLSSSKKDKHKIDKMVGVVKSCADPSKCQTVDKSNEHTVSVSTVEGWMFELSQLKVAEWLQFDRDAKGKARNLRCKFCIQLGSS